MNARIAILLVGMLFIALVIAGIFQPLFVQATFYLLFGWLQFLVNASSRIEIDWAAVAAGVITLALLTAGLHGLLSWVVRQRAAAAGSESPRRRWAWRWSAAITGVVVLMFVAGIASIGLTHQTGWLISARQPLVERRLAMSGGDSNLESIGMSFTNYNDIQQSLPQGGTSSADGTMLHSWMTQILPYSNMMFWEQIDHKLPWDHPKNAAEFRRFVPDYLNPEVGQLRSQDGFALAHYAGNVHVVGGGPPLRMSDISDGASQTILAGEVAAEFKPWGSPMNWRDPSDGVNRLASGFASPSGKAVQFVFVDGSVRSFGAETSPAVLRAMATPRGGERADVR